MNGLEDEYGTAVTFYRFDADEPANQSVQKDLDLRGHPSAAILDANGQVVQRFFGVHPAEAIIPYLDTLSANNES